ncbi:MAG: hypothetical protein ACJ0G3_01870 [Dehalococcoidia bacterium]|tara:strand:- start:45 stop:284 length:240 start_codon:yes stop_codon:yes gene_type:complete
MPDIKKSKKMLQVEKKYRRSLERLLPELINDNGLTATANELGIGKALLGYWLLKLQIRVVRVALGPNDKFEIIKSTERD